jgi:hypothetical protein
MNQFFQMLKKDHEEVKGILGQLKETNYPPMLAKKETREDSMDGVEEHHVSDMVLKGLETMPKGDDQRQMLDQIIQQGI